MLTNAAIGMAIVLAGVYFVLPYHQAHKRRKELARKNQVRRAGVAGNDAQ
jgi:hypothetical protein